SRRTRRHPAQFPAPRTASARRVSLFVQSFPELIPASMSEGRASRLTLASHCLYEFRRSGVEDGLVIGAAEVVGLPLIDGLRCSRCVDCHGAHNTQGTIVYRSAQFRINRV